MKIGLLFPGQGYQRLGLLAKFMLHDEYRPTVEMILQRVDAALPQLRLSRALVETEPASAGNIDVTPTEIAQPLILAASYAYQHSLLAGSKVRPQLALGHSLGEYSAYVAAGLIPFESALKLVHERGLAMKDAAAQAGEPTGMLASHLPRKGMDSATFEQKVVNVAKKHDVDVAAFNSEAQIVLSGRVSSLQAIKAELKPVIATLLPVAGAFHSRFMAPAQQRLRELVEKEPWVFPANLGVISNVTAREYSSLDEIKKSCVDALVKPVLWRQSVRHAVSDLDGVVSLGPGTVGKLTLREILPKATLNLDLE